jgi:hypothetical protein
MRSNTSMLQPRITPTLTIACVLVGTGACVTMKPPATNSGPALSANGVQIAVLRQACSQMQAIEDVPSDSGDETVEIQVRNGSPEPVSVHRDRFRLLGPDGSALATVTSSPADPLEVAKGETQTFELQFATHGLECTKEMRLDPDAGITLGESPVALRPVSFVPSGAL